MRQLLIAFAFFPSIVCGLGSWGQRQTGRLAHNDLTYWTMPTVLACQQFCESETWGNICQSIDYNMLTNYCYLNGKRKGDDPINWAEEPYWVYSERVPG